MNKKEADQIIKNYKPHPGFYDLSVKSATLTTIEFAKVLKIQVYLAWQESNKAYLIKLEPIQWQEMKELSADYQGIVRENWDVNKL